MVMIEQEEGLEEVEVTSEEEGRSNHTRKGGRCRQPWKGDVQIWKRVKTKVDNEEESLEVVLLEEEDIQDKLGTRVREWTEEMGGR